MKLSTSLLLAALSLLLIGSPAYCQQITIEPPTIDFGDIPIGSVGQPVADRTITLINQTDSVFAPDRIGSLSFIYFDVNLPEVAAARSALRAIWDSVGCYIQDYGEYPDGIDALSDRGYLSMSEELSTQWQFGTIGYAPITALVAVSTARNPRGEGISIVFDTQRGEFWQDPVFNSGETLTIQPHDSATLVVSFHPDTTKPYEDHMELLSVDGWDVRSEDDCFFRGTGVWGDSAATDRNEISFGNIRGFGMVEQEFTLSNTSTDMIGYDFIFGDDPQDSDWRFSVYDPEQVGDIVNTLRAIMAAAISYRARYGHDPSNVEELSELGYLVIPDDVLRRWTPALIGNSPLTQIEAVSTAELRWGAGHTLLYDVQTNRFTGFGVDYTVLGTGRSKNLIATFSPRQYGSIETKMHICDGWYLDLATIAIRANVLGVSNDDVSFLPSTICLSPAFPNPFNSSTFVSYSTPLSGPVNATLVDISGREVMQWTGLPAGQGRIAVDGSNLATGEYWLKLHQNGNSAATKVVLVR